MDHSVARGCDIYNYLRCCNVIPARVVHDVQAGRRSAIDRKHHIAAILLEPLRLGEEEMSLVSPRRDGIAAMKDAASPTGKERGLFSSLDSVARNRERVPSRAVMVAVPSGTVAICVGGGSVAHRNAKNSAGRIARSSSGVELLGAFTPTRPIPCSPEKNRQQRYRNRKNSDRSQGSTPYCELFLGFAVRRQF